MCPDHPHSPEDPNDCDTYDVIKFTVDCANGWFRSLYKFGVWVPGEEAKRLTDLAFGLTEPLNELQCCLYVQGLFVLPLCP